MSNSENRAENADSSGISIYIGFSARSLRKSASKITLNLGLTFTYFFNMKNKPQVKLIYTKLKSNVSVLN